MANTPELGSAALQAGETLNLDLEAVELERATKLFGTIGTGTGTVNVN